MGKRGYTRCCDFMPARVCASVLAALASSRSRFGAACSSIRPWVKHEYVGCGETRATSSGAPMPTCVARPRRSVLNKEENWSAWHVVEPLSGRCAWWNVYPEFAQHRLSSQEARGPNPAA